MNKIKYGALLVTLFVSCSPLKIHKKYWENSHVIKSENQYHKKVRHGIQREYNEKGILVGEYYYDNDTIDGFTVSYFDNGKVKNIYWSERGKLNGKYLSFYETGELYQIKEYIDNKLNGSIVNYHKNGMVCYRSEYCLSNCVGEVDSLGNITERNTPILNKESVLCGAFYAYFENGSISTQGYYYSGFLLKKEVSTDGMVQSSFLPVKDGVWRYYNPNGELKGEEVYYKGLKVK